MLSITGPARCNIRNYDTAQPSGSSPHPEGKEEEPFYVTASPDQLLLAYWTNSRLHICTATNEFESIIRLDLSSSYSSSSSLSSSEQGLTVVPSPPSPPSLPLPLPLPHSSEVPVPTFRKLLWKPLSSSSPSSSSTDNPPSPPYYTDEYTLAIGTSTQILLVQLLDQSKVKTKTMGWLEWFLQDNNNSHEDSKHTKGSTTNSSSSVSSAASVLNDNDDFHASSSVSSFEKFLSTRPWKLNVLTTLTVDKDHTYTSLSVHSKGLCIGKSNGAIIVLQWTGEIIAEMDPRKALVLAPSGRTTSTNYSLKYSSNPALHAVTALETIYDQGTILPSERKIIKKSSNKNERTMNKPSISSPATEEENTVIAPFLITMVAGYKDGITLVFSVLFSSVLPHTGSSTAAASTNSVVRIRIPLESITVLSLSPTLTLQTNSATGKSTSDSKEDNYVYPLDIVSYIPTWQNGNYNENIIVAIAYSDNTVVVYQTLQFPSVTIRTLETLQGKDLRRDIVADDNDDTVSSLTIVTVPLSWNFITSMPVSDIGSMSTDSVTTTSTVHSNLGTNEGDNEHDLDIETYLNSPLPNNKTVIQSTVMGIRLSFRQNFTPDLPWICSGGNTSLALSIISMNYHYHTTNHKSILQSILSVWSFPCTTDANVSLQYVKTIQYNNLSRWEDNNMVVPSSAEKPTISPPSLAWMKWGTSLFVTSTMLTGRTNNRRTVPLLSKIEFADMAAEHLRTGINTSISAIGGQWAVSSNALYQLVIVQPPFPKDSTDKGSNEKNTGNKTENTKAKTNNKALPSPSTALSTVKPMIPTELGDAYILWRNVPISAYYFPVQQPVRLISSTVDGQRIAIAGRKGVAVYNVKREQWHVFSRPREEEQVCARAMCWFSDRILFVIHSDDETTMNKTVKYRLQAYPHTHLDFESRLFDMEINVPTNHRIIGITTGSSTITSLPLNTANPTTPKSQAAETLPCKVPWLAVVSQSIVEKNQTQLSLYRVVFNSKDAIVNNRLQPIKVVYNSSNEFESNMNAPFSSLVSNSSSSSLNASLLIANTIKVDGANGRICNIPEEVTIRPAINEASIELVANFDLPMNEIFSTSSSVNTLSECIILGTNFTEIDTTPEELRNLTLEGILTAAQSAPVSKKKKPKALQSSSAPWLWSLYFPDMALRLSNGSVFILHGRKGIISSVVKGDSAVSCVSMWLVPSCTFGFENENGNILLLNTGSSIMAYVVNEDRFPSHIDTQIVTDTMNITSEGANSQETKRESVYPLINNLPSSRVSILDSHSPYFIHAADRLEGIIQGACAVVVSAGSAVTPIERSVPCSWSSIHSLVHDNRLPPIPIGISMVPTLPVLLNAITDIDDLTDRCTLIDLSSRCIRKQYEGNVPHIRTSLCSFLHDAIEEEVKASALTVARQIVIDNIPMDISSSCSTVSAAVLRTLAGALKTYLKSKSLKVADVMNLLPKETLLTLRSTTGVSTRSDSTFQTRTLALSTNLRLLRDAGSLPFLDIVSSVGRTMDEDHLQYLFPSAGEPRQLFNEAITNAKAVSMNSTAYHHSYLSLRYLRIASSCILLVQEYSWRKEIHGKHGPAVLTKAKLIVEQSIQDCKELLLTIGLSSTCIDQLLREISNDQYTSSLPDDELAKVRSEIILSSQPPPDFEILGALLHLTESVRQYVYRLRIAAQDHAREEKALSLLGNKLANIQKGGTRLGSIATAAMKNAVNEKKATESISLSSSEGIENNDTTEPSSTPAPISTPTPAPVSKGWSLFRAAAYFIGMGDEDDTKTVEASSESVASVSLSSSLSSSNETRPSPTGTSSSSSSSSSTVPRSLSLPSVTVQHDSILKFLLQTTIPILGRYTVKVNPRDPLPFEIGSVSSLSITNDTLSPVHFQKDNPELFAVQSATYNSLQSQFQWLTNQLQDLHGAIGHVNRTLFSVDDDTATTSLHPLPVSSPPSSPSFRSNDRLVKINTVALNGARISAIQSTLQQLMSSTSSSLVTIECYRIVSLSVLQILAGMFDLDSEPP